MYLVKMIRYPDSFREDMQNPIMASVFCTSTMALMLLAGYLKPYIGVVGDVIWYAAIVLHVVLMLYFTAKFILKLQMPKVFASYFIVYVGIVVASVSAPAFGATGLGTGIFWFGFAVLLALLVPVTYRYAKFREIPPPAQPLFCIYTAPTSLCLAGYIQSVQNKSIAMIAFLAILATVLYLVVLVKLPKYLKMPFFPSYAAFTFPFVILGHRDEADHGLPCQHGQPDAVAECGGHRRDGHRSGAVRLRAGALHPVCHREVRKS